AAAPAANRLAHRNAPERSRAAVRHQARQPRRLLPRATGELLAGLGLQVVGDPPRQVLGGTGHPEQATVAPDRPPRPGRMADAVLDAEDRDDGAVREGHALGQLGEPPDDPAAVALDEIEAA